MKEEIIKQLQTYVDNMLAASVKPLDADYALWEIKEAISQQRRMYRGRLEKQNEKLTGYIVSPNVMGPINQCLSLTIEEAGEELKKALTAGHTNLVVFTTQITRMEYASMGDYEWNPKQ